MRADLAELMDQGEAAQDGVIMHIHVTGQRRIVGEDRVVADHAIVRDMDIRHDPVVVADFRRTDVLHRTAIKRTVFSNGILVADFQRGRLTLVFLVLGGLAQRAEMIDLVVAADGGRPLDHDVRTDTRAAVDADAGPDYAVRPDLDVGRQLCLGVDNG